MSCEYVGDRLSAFADGEIEDADRTMVEGHLRECAGCRAGLDRLRRLAGLFEGAATPPVAEDLARRTMALARRRARTRRFLAAAAVLLGFILGGILGADTWRPVRTPASDPAATHGVEYFGEAPSGSLTGAYVSVLNGD